MVLTLDPWQKEFLATKGNKMLLCGRQVGKSMICSMDAAEYAVNHARETILIVAPTERQSYALFDKTLDYLSQNYPHKIAKGRDRPTKHLVHLTNGSKIYSLPTGLSGIGIRFLTINRLYIDECQNVPKAVETAVTPMLLTTGGDSIYLGTPFGRDNFFAQEFEDEESDFTKFNVDSETVVKERKICSTWPKWRRDKALEHIERARRRMTRLEFAQEYEGQIIRELKQFFPIELIEKCMTIDPEKATVPKEQGLLNVNLFLGVDIARKGGDETVLVSLARVNRERLVMFHMNINDNSFLTETVKRIKNADLRNEYKLMYIDDGGLGAGVYDMLLDDEHTRRRVVAINNASRSLNVEESQRKRLMKEDLYTNLLSLMEDGRIALFKSPEVLLSLSSVQYEYKESGRLHIYGKYTHIAEALIRAAWCIQDKALNIWIR